MNRPAHHDYLRQRQAVTDAINHAHQNLRAAGFFDGDKPLDAEGARAEVRVGLASLTVAWPWPPPEIAFDLPAEATVEGLCLREINTISLRPDCAHPWTILTLLAHFVTPGSAYGPTFTAALIAMVRGDLGDEAADALIWSLIEHGAAWDDNGPEDW